jgi:hypothetical protein
LWNCCDHFYVLHAGRGDAQYISGGEYYDNRNLQGGPVLARNDKGIDFNWGTGSPALVVNADNFSVRWTQHIDFEEGAYRFCVEADDGVSVEMDDQRPFIREWHDGPGTYCAEVYVTGGRHKTRVEHFEHLGNASVTFWWQQTSTVQVLPEDHHTW